MKGAYRMSNPKTSKDTFNATSSLASQAGPTPSNSPDGPQIGLFGQPVAPARPSQSPESKSSVRSAKAKILCGALDELATQYARDAKTRGLPMPATYGQKFGDSSRNADLDRSSESRLTAFLRSIGWPLYKHRLKYSATVLGRRVFRLRASARSTSEGGFSGWPTPLGATENSLRGTGQDPIRRKEGGHQVGLQDAVRLTTGWTTPQAHDAQGNPNPGRLMRHGTKHGCKNLNDEVGLMAGWVSPTAQDGRRGGKPPRPHDTGIPLSQQVALAGWATPAARDHKSESATDEFQQDRIEQTRGKPLSWEVRLAGWTTPQATEPTGRDLRPSRVATGRTTEYLGRQVQLAASGPTPSLSSAATESGDRSQKLNPAFSCWLMGFSIDWLMLYQKSLRKR